jgi:hypothetical protein
MASCNVRCSEDPERAGAKVARVRGPAAILLAAALAGCGQSSFGKNIQGFTQQAKSPGQESVLRSIASYRTTPDAARACSLITAHFLQSRFDGKPAVCAAVARSAKRELPRKATVERIAGPVATVRIDEPTATRSIYKMRYEGGSWKIDDIVEAK